MIITSSYPAIATREAERVVAELKKLGFAVIFQRRNMLEASKKVYVMLHSNGMRADVVSTDLVFTDTHVAHMEIQDFEQALNAYRKDDYKIVKGPLVENDNKVALIKSKEGVMILLVQHICM